MKALIDGDVLLYEAAFAAQKTRYVYRPQNILFEDHAAWKLWASEHDLDYKTEQEAGNVEKHLDVFPEEMALHIAKMKRLQVLSVINCSDYTLFLSGDTNYRNDIAVTKVYKGNRTQDKPVHYQAVKHYYTGHQNTVVTDGVEADDAIGIAMQLEHDGVICTIDKDLNMISGRHYDWGRGIKYVVPSNIAEWFFCRQLLTGDSVDNIPGLPGVGKAKAERILGDATECVPSVAFKAVVDTYKDVVQDDSWESYLLEQGQLLWIQRERGQLWSPEMYQHYLQGV